MKQIFTVYIQYNHTHDIYCIKLTEWGTPSLIAAHEQFALSQSLHGLQFSSRQAEVGFAEVTQSNSSATIRI